MEKHQQRPAVRVIGTLSPRLDLFICNYLSVSDNKWHLKYLLKHICCHCCAYVPRAALLFHQFFHIESQQLFQLFQLL